MASLCFDPGGDKCTQVEKPVPRTLTARMAKETGFYSRAVNRGGGLQRGTVPLSLSSSGDSWGRMPKTPLSPRMVLVQCQVLFLSFPLHTLVVVFFLQVPHRGPAVPLKVLLVVWGRGGEEGELFSVIPAGPKTALDALRPALGYSETRQPAEKAVHRC